MSLTQHPTDRLQFDVIPPPAGRVSEAEFLAWCTGEIRAEWVDGQVIMMSPASEWLWKARLPKVSTILAELLKH